MAKKSWAQTGAEMEFEVTQNNRLTARHLLIGTVALSTLALSADVHAVSPPDSVVAGPYSPGLMANGFLYLSGQGPAGSDGKIPAGFEAQMVQTLKNVKNVLAAGGLTIQHLVYAQVYLKDMANYEEMNRLWKEAFPHMPPARAVLGVYRLPGDGLVEITAIAVRDLSQRSVVTVSRVSGELSFSRGDCRRKGLPVRILGSGCSGESAGGSKGPG